MNDYDRIKKIADTLPELDRAFLNKVADSLREKTEACALHIKTHELNFANLEFLMQKCKNAGLMEQGK